MKTSDSINQFNENPSNVIEITWRNEIAKHSLSERVISNIKISRRIIKNLSYLCGLDINRFDKFYSKRQNKYIDLFDSRFVNVPIFIKFIRILYVICSIMLIIYLKFQYRYDLNLQKYILYTKYLSIDITNNNDEEIKHSYISTMKNNKHSDINNNSSSFIEKLKNKVEYDRNILISMGATFLDHSFAVEYDYIYILFISFVTFVETFIYSRYVYPIDLRTIKTIYDRERIIKHYSEIVADEVKKFILSSRNFVITTLNISRLDYLKQLKLLQYKKDSKKYQISRIISDHYSNIEQLKLMALESKLIPINKRSQWIDNLTIMYNQINSLTFISSVIIFTIFWATQCIYYGVRSGIMDAIHSFTFFVPSAIATLYVFFYFGAIVINTIDYIILAMRLKTIINYLINENSSKIKEILHSDKQQLSIDDKTTTSKLSIEQRETNIGEHSDSYFVNDNISIKSTIKLKKNQTDRENYSKYLDLNHDLLFVLIQYKLFMRQLKYNKPTITYVVFCTLQIQIMGPILLFIELPFIKSQFVPILISSFAAFFILIADCNLVPIAFMHNRCLDLCKALFSLMAHSSEFINLETGEYVYSKHTIKLLSKELSLSEEFVKQFGVILFGYPITYPTLLRLHTLLGLLMVYSLSNHAKSMADKSLLENSFKSMFF